MGLRSIPGWVSSCSDWRDQKWISIPITSDPGFALDLVLASDLEHKSSELTPHSPSPIFPSLSRDLIPGVVLSPVQGSVLPLKAGCKCDGSAVG